jgi:D-alanyl-D-alanine carboxypeptidase (penicillin-binding protein 5/6)
LLYIVFKRLSEGSLQLDQKIIVPDIAWYTAGSSMHLKAKQQVTINTLIRGTIVASGNDASVALSIFIAGTQEGFVNIMNFEANNLGMSNTHFSNVMGLPAPNLYTSARDVAVLAQHLIKDYPQYYRYFRKKSVSINGFTIYNYNKLLFIYPYADGIKTGSTNSSGYSLASSAIKQGRRLISVIIGSSSLIKNSMDSKTLLEYGFSNFKTQIFYPANYKIASLRVYKGIRDYTDVGLPVPVTVSYPSYLDPRKTHFLFHKNENKIESPIKLGTRIGKLDVTYKNQVIKTFPIVTLRDNPLGSSWKYLRDTILLLV